MKQYYLAIDIGASSGRHILASVSNGKLKLEEIYRFPNGLIEKDGQLCWEIDRLYEEIKQGLKRCKELNKIPVSMGIDTWGVDYVLLDKENQLLGNAVSYRDARTDGMIEALEQRISKDALYEKTGIQPQSYNTIYQLLAVKKTNPNLLEQTNSFLMIAPYLNFLLTGEKKNEYTNVSTTGMMNCHTKEWEEELLNILGLSKETMGEIVMPGTMVGEFTKEIQEELGFNCKVILPATHDTASAVLAVPFEEDVIYISSGTWSLMGIELEAANCTTQSLDLGLTNEGSATGKICCLQNIMGLWMIQSIKKNLNNAYTFGELSQMAEEYADFPSVLNVNDPCFMAPNNMIEEIKAYCERTNQKIPQEIGELMQCVYQSLAKSYKEAADAIEELNGRRYDKIAIVGGGCQDSYLNNLTEKVTGKKVSAGPIEATAIGNILVQMLADKTVKSVNEIKKLI